MTELNPNNQTIKKLSGQWHKICYFLLAQTGKKEVVITLEDLKATFDGPPKYIVSHEQQDGLHLRLVDEAEAMRLANQHGGLPPKYN